MALVPFPSPQSGALPIPPDDDDDNPAAGKMSFLEHLDERRKRFVRSCLAIAFGVLATFYWIQPNAIARHERTMRFRSSSRCSRNDIFPATDVSSSSSGGSW